MITDILNSFEIYILPVWNVDGYDYTWTTVTMLKFNLVLGKLSVLFNIIIFMICGYCKQI